MTPDGALLALGLDRSAAWSEIRARHRALIRSVHPDVGGDVRRAAELNEALAVLAGEMAEGARPLPTPQRTAPPEAPDAKRLLHLDVAPSELVMRFADAAHEVGEVVFVDSGAGLVEIIVGHGAAAAQLVVSVGDPGTGGVPVAFVLEPLGVGSVPPKIDDIVDALAAAVQARR